MARDACACYARLLASYLIKDCYAPSAARILGMAVNYWRSDRRRPLVDRFGKTLRTLIENVAQEPMPERWIDLIRRLDAEEREGQERDQPKEGK